MGDAPVETRSPSDVNHPVAVLDDKVTIAVAAHGNLDATRTCLEAILRSARGAYELLLIDDCSKDDNATFAVFQQAKERHVNTVIYQTTTKNLEYSGSVNAILSHAKGEFIFFVSNDIITTPYYFSTILHIAEVNPMAGLIRGSSNYVDNGLASHNLQPINTINTLEDVFREGRDVAGLFGDYCVEDPYLTGDAFMVSRGLIEKIGTYDPLFYGYFSDHDYGLRATIAGYSLLLAPGAYAYHMEHANYKHLNEEEYQQKLMRRWRRVMENWARFKMKYHMPVELEYNSTNDIPWADLSQEEFTVERHFSPPGNYSDCLCP
ncbi:MAG: glycosyltransferase [Cyanobacteriota bacterium]|nr:glycosyltransferase [Cyanobacteriota bacterium]